MAKKKEPTFAEARARLDEILDDVESDSGDVDQLAAKVREASELIRLCRDRLSAARAEVSRVVADLSAVERTVGPHGGETSEDGDATDGGLDEDDEDDGADEADEGDVGDEEAGQDGGNGEDDGGTRSRTRSEGGELPF